MAKKKSYSTTNQTAISPPVIGQITTEATQVDSSKPYDEVTKDLLSYIADANNVKSKWSQKLDFYYRLRYRLRRNKDWPFFGCSNLGLPTIEKFLRKIKANLFNVIWGIRPRSIIIPEGAKSFDLAMRMEHYLDWLLEIKIKFAKKLSIALDKMLEKGFCVLEPLWVIKDEKRKFDIDLQGLPKDMLSLIFSAIDTEDETIIGQIANMFGIDMSETVKEENVASIKAALTKLRSGQDKVQITVADETYNNVDILIHDPENVFVPADSGIDPQDCRFVAYEVYESWDIVKQKANSGIYDKEAFSDMESYKEIGKTTPSQGKDSFNPSRTTDILKDQREGIERANNQSRAVKLYRTYAWYDLDGDGIEERNVFILAPEWNKCLKAFPFPYSHRKWPCIRLDAEVTDDRWYSPRGIPEMLEDIAKEIDTQHNQKIDQQTIRNVPMFAYRSGVVNSRFVKFIPGQAVPVNGLTPLEDAIKVLRNESSNAEYSYRDEEMLLKLEVSELYGVTDYGTQSVINRRQPRTASEVMAQQQSGSVIFSLDSLLLSDSISELFTQVVGLTQQYLPDEVFFSIAGEGASAKLTREEIQGSHLIRTRGNDINTNAQKRLEMAQAKIQMLANPFAIQSGMYTPVNHYNAMKEYLQYTGDANWQAKISMPQPPPPPAPPPAITNIKTNFDELTDIEQAQVLASAGIKPDMQGRLMHRQEDIVEKMSEPKPQTNGASSVK
jgi:hypothetical protein